MFLDLIWYSTWNSFNCKIIQFHLVAQMIKNLPAVWEIWIQSWVGTIPWRRKWWHTPLFLPGEFHGQKSLVGYSPWGRRVGHDWTTATNTVTFLQAKYTNIPFPKLTCFMWTGNIYTYTYTHTYIYIYTLYYESTGINWISKAESIAFPYKKFQLTHVKEIK